jgi:hypothetical protein
VNTTNPFARTPRNIVDSVARTAYTTWSTHYLRLAAAAAEFDPCGHPETLKNIAQYTWEDLDDVERDIWRVVVGETCERLIALYREAGSPDGDGAPPPSPGAPS